jgi:hypothetical protein
VHQNWMRLLKMAKLMIEIVKETRNLLFWTRSWAGSICPSYEYGMW